MAGPIQSPVKGQPMRASWGAAVSSAVNSLLPMGSDGLLARQGVAGSGFSPLPANKRDRRVAAVLHPWKVFAVGKSEDVDHFFEIYIPDGSITVGANEVEVDGIEETETAKRFTFACESDVGESSTLHLVVYRDEEEKSEDDEKNYKSVLAVDIEEYEDDESVRSIIPIAELSVVEGEGGEYDRGKVVSQMQNDAIILDDFDVPTDKVSIDKVTKKDAEDPDALQLKNFDNNESDGSQGLAERLELEKSGSGESATYRIKAKSNDSKVHILARVNGKIKYIPISGNDEKDPDEEDPPPEGDPCAHPGDKDNTGGVNPYDDEPGGVGGGDDPSGGGGVSPSGETHPGDDGCNCD